MEAASQLSSPSEPIEKSLTPMMKQWTELKARAGTALLFFRLGDFYELFEDDAIRAAPVLGVTLTSRNNRSGAQNSPPLCGVPAVTLETYLTKALDHGFKVALVEQTEDPAATKTIVRREIVQWFSPGIRLLQSDERAHYAGVVVGKPEGWVLAAADVGTGHLVLETGTSLESLQETIERLPIEDLRLPFRSEFDLSVKYFEHTYIKSETDSEEILLKAFGLSHLDDLDIKNAQAVSAVGTLIGILNEAHPRERLFFLRPNARAETVWMSASTRKNLNLFEPENANLFQTLDRTQTAMGRRELKFMLNEPTMKRDILRSRQELVSFFKGHPFERKEFRSSLISVLDIHRLLRRRRGPRELYQLSQSLSRGLKASELFSSSKKIPVLLKDFLGISRDLKLLATELERSLILSEEEFGWIAGGVNPVLDELREFHGNASRLLSELEEKLRADTKVSSLKIKFHQVFGYIAEVTATHKEKVPVSARRIQTLANAERFKTAELEELETKLLSLDSRIREVERAEWSRLYDLVEQERERLLRWSGVLGSLDAYQSLAEVSSQMGWTTPVTLDDDESRLHIEKAFHPLSKGSFVPLSFVLSREETQIVLLTGPNMAGKSTVLRLAALNALLHQIGSDVPAAKAELSLFDRIVCRMGATDDLTTGQSTFFVEMREVASMLHGATSRSLLIFDEIGRGTSTYDGMSLAWAITENVHELRALSVIATHYLELAELEKSLLRLKNFHLGVEEVNHRLLFTRRLERGPASRSYGIHVAKLADVPASILQRAEEKLHEFEKKRSKPISLMELFEA